MPELHAKHSPSQLKNKAICPHWTNDASGDSTAADEGTMLHDIMEKWALSLRNPRRKFELPDLEPEQSTAIGFAMKHVEAPIRQAEFAGIEVQLRVDGLTWGTCDLCLLMPGRKYLDLKDYKFGKWLVDDPDKNWQAKFYTLGAFTRFPEAETAQFTFITPRRKIIQDHTWTREEAESWIPQIKGIIEAAENPDSPYNPDSDNCLFCGTKATCPVMADRFMTIAEKYDGLQLPSRLDTTALTKPEDVELALNLASIAERWAKNVKSAATELAMEGVEIPGYSLTQSAGNRKIQDVEGAWSALKTQIPEESFLNACSLSITNLEKALKGVAPHGQKQEFASSTMEALDSLGLVKRGADKTYLKKNRK